MSSKLFLEGYFFISGFDTDEPTKVFFSIIFEISSQYDLDRFNTFKLPEATPGINSVEFDENTSKDNILYKVLVEVKIGAIW